MAKHWHILSVQRHRDFRQIDRRVIWFTIKSAKALPVLSAMARLQDCSVMVEGVWTAAKESKGENLPNE